VATAQGDVTEQKDIRGMIARIYDEIDKEAGVQP